MSNLKINRFVSVKWKNHGQCNECFSCVSSFPSSQALCAVFFLIDFKLLPFLESREEQCPLQRVGAFLYNKQMFLTSIILHKKISCLFLGGVGVFAILKQSVIITWGELDAGRVMSNSRTLLMIIHEKVRNVSARVVTVGKVISSIRTETTQYQILMLYSFMCISWHFLSLMCPRLFKGTARYFAKSYFSVFRMKKNVSFLKTYASFPQMLWWFWCRILN